MIWAVRKSPWLLIFLLWGSPYAVVLMFVLAVRAGFLWGYRYRFADPVPRPASIGIGWDV